MALDVDLAGGVHQDVGDLRVAEQRLDRSEAVHLVEDLLAQVLAVAVAERDGELAEQLRDRRPQLVLGLVQVHAGEVGEVDPVEQQAMDAKLQVLIGPVGRALPPLRGGPGGSRLVLRHGRQGLLVESDAILQLHARVSLVKMRCSR